MNIYEVKEKNFTRLLAVLIMGMFIVSMVPTLNVTETETPLTTGTPTIPVNDDVIEFVNTLIGEVENARSRTPWERLNTPLQTYVKTGEPTPDMVLVKGLPRVDIFALGGFSYATLPDELTVTRVANLGFLTVIEALVSEPKSLLRAAEIDGVLAIEADLYLDERLVQVGPTLETKSDWVTLKDQANRMAADILADRGIDPFDQVIRELSGANAVESAYNLNGSGVRIHSMDTGVDFGIPNLAPAIDLDSAGYPTTYDDGGEGLLYAPLRGIEGPGGIIPVGADWSSVKFQRSYQGGGDQAFDLNIYSTALGVPVASGTEWQVIKVPTGQSLSGVWKLGYTRIGGGGPYYLFAATAFCDPNTAGVYDRMYIDWDATFAVSAIYQGVITDFEYGTSQVNWDLTDEHTAVNYWDMKTTPAAALVAGNSSVWSMSYDYWNGSFLGFDKYGRHVNTTIEYSVNPSTRNDSSFIIEYQYPHNPYLPMNHLDNRVNLTMVTDYKGSAGVLTNASYTFNGVWEAEKTWTYRLYGVNATNSSDITMIYNWKTVYVDNVNFADGYPDISLGSLCHAYDSNDQVPGYDYISFMTGDADETYANLMYDHGSGGGQNTHGTCVAMDLVARGNVDDSANIPLYDVLLNGSATFDLRGQAPGASLLVTKSFSSGSRFWNMLWMAAIDVVVGEKSGYFSDGNYMADWGSWVNHNTWAITYETSWKDYDEYGWIPDYANSTVNPMNFAPVNISTHSTGWSYYYGPGAGLYPEDIIRDALCLPGTISATWPGMTIINAAGNSGPGYANGFGSNSELLIQVGAATTGHYGEETYGTAWNNEVAPFTTRGPGTYFEEHTDILAYGAWHQNLYIPNEVWNGYESGWNGWGGTSAAAPVAAGTIALILQAAAENGTAWSPTPQEVKALVMSTAEDFGADPFTQGAGFIDVQAAVDWIRNSTSTETVMFSNATHIAMEWWLEDVFPDFMSDFLGIKKDFDNSVGFDSTFFAGIVNAGQDVTTQVYRWDGNMTLETTVPSAYYHALNSTLTRTATFSNNATWDAALSDAFVGPANSTTGAVAAWNLTKALFDNATYLNTWATDDDGYIALQIAVKGTEPSANDYFYLHAWDDADSDGRMEFANTTYTDPDADDWWNSFLEYTSGEAARITHAYPGSPQTIWLRSATLASLSPTFTLALRQGSGWPADLNFTITAEFYTIQTWDWIDITAEGSGYNVTVAVPPAAEAGNYEGFLRYGDVGEAILPISFMVPIVPIERNATETTAGPVPIVTDEYLPGLIYDNAEYRQGDQSDPAPDSRYFLVYVDQWNATGLSITQNWTNTGMDMYTAVYDFYGSLYGDNQASATATKMTTVAEITGDSWYIIRTECQDFNGLTTRANVDMAVAWTYTTPSFIPVPTGYTGYPDDDDTIGVAGHSAGDYCFNVTWTNQATTDYPDAAIVSSSLEIAAPPLEFEQAYTSVSPYPDFFIEIGKVLEGTALYVELTWEVNPGGDMMDAYLLADGVRVSRADVCDLATGGGSPESCSFIVASTAVYSMEISNFAAADNHGYVRATGFLAGVKETSTTNQVGMNTLAFPTDTWALVALATDNFGTTYQYGRSLYINNVVAPEVEITTTLSGTLTGTQSVAIDVFDMNVNNSGILDDQEIFLSVYLSTDIPALSRVPVALYIDVTTIAAADGTYTFSWDTTAGPNTYSGNLWVALTDGRDTVWDDMGPFEIVNTAGAAAGMSNSGNHSLTIPLVSLLVAVLGVGTMPIVLKALRKRRA